MKFNYQNRTGGFQLLPDGEYQVEITAVETKISNGATTRGSDMWVLTIRETETGTELEDQLIFHPKCEWKIDTVLRSIGRAPTGAQEIDLATDTFKGGRATVHVVTETYKKNSDATGQATGKSNKIAAWLSPQNAQAKPAAPEDF